MSRLHAERSERQVIRIGRTGQMASVRMCRNALDYGSELNIATLYILEKSIEFERMVPVVIIDYCKRIPFTP